MDIRPIFYVIGILLCTLAAGMVLPIIADYCLLLRIHTPIGFVLLCEWPCVAC